MAVFVVGERTPIRCEGNVKRFCKSSCGILGSTGWFTKSFYGVMLFGDRGKVGLNGLWA